MVRYLRLCKLICYVAFVQCLGFRVYRVKMGLGAGRSCSRAILTSWSFRSMSETPKYPSIEGSVPLQHDETRKTKILTPEN